MKISPIAGQTVDLLESHCAYKRRVITRYDWDWWTLHSGEEGTGKSTEAIWECLYTDDTFRRDWWNRITYEAESFLEAIDRAKKGQSIILDEAGEAWYRPEWYDATHRALDKAAMQVRYKNLDLHVVVPFIDLVGWQALRRARDWVYVDAPGFKRGHMDLYRSSKSRFGGKKRRMPYFELMLDYNFRPLPAQFYDAYRIFKAEAAEERLAKYIGGMRPTIPETQARYERVLLVAAEIEAKTDRDRFRNSHGTFDLNLIWYEYGGRGCKMEDSRAIARALTAKLGKVRPGAGV